MKDTVTGRITDIQRTSLRDGPGIRTTVFFKGCPLACAWCHNPECIDREIQELFYPEKCIGCGKCAQGCYAGARVQCGRDITVDALLAELTEDKAYYANGGGVTFSGGEPLMQPELLGAAIDRCREAGVSCAVETSLALYDAALLAKTDLVMADLKIWDSELHRKYTGAPNERIKEHFKALDALGVPIVARTPVIPEIEQGIPEIAAFLRGLRNVTRYELLPYHPLGLEKSRALGRPGTRFTVPSGALMTELNQYAFLR